MVEQIPFLYYHDKGHIPNVCFCVDPLDHNIDEARWIILIEEVGGSFMTFVFHKKTLTVKVLCGVRCSTPVLLDVGRCIERILNTFKIDRTLQEWTYGAITGACVSHSPATSGPIGAFNAILVMESLHHKREIDLVLTPTDNHNQEYELPRRKEDIFFLGVIWKLYVLRQNHRHSIKRRSREIGREIASTLRH